ncbi:hypothetical protein Poly51_43620 [Rubripirellula tenax]|uniref:Planctomycete cytochrome C n=1 Tax=Rubripirellula tenax TaxID=2528015 RepID=A0A5C6EQ77_9BACT|nr:DUF1592 domain-containing protein [Rubripirellula tenax]TWU51068.1 hypothetical protein Poly51_43620 [Rubripirellula tenax]
MSFTVSPIAARAFAILLGLFNVTAFAVEASPLPKQTDAFIQSKCVDCHDGPGGDGGFDARALSHDLNDPKTMQRWVRIFDRVRDGEMPPDDSVEVDPDEADQFLVNTSAWLHDAQKSHFDQVGRVQSRRLTNAQLERTLQDLFAIDVPLARLMPEEQRFDGFTGLADHQSISHFQLDSHLTVVDAALDAARRRVMEPDNEFRRDYDARAIARKNPNSRCRDPEMIDGKAVVWSSGLIFYGRITSSTIAEDGWYRITFDATSVNTPNDSGVWCSVRNGRCVSNAPLLSWIGSFEATQKRTTHTYDAWFQAGDMIEIRPGDETLKRAKFAGGQVGAGEGGPQKVPGVALHSMVVQRIHPAGDIDVARRHLLGDLSVSIDTKKKRIQINSEKLFADLSKQLRRFATRAFRRPVEGEELKPYVQWMRQSLDDGADPIDALMSAYRAILCSPRFLYFVEPMGPLDDHAIATRLSYLLCGSMPDWTLTKLAREGKLRNPKALRGEVDRLLASKRGQTFARDFADQWLDISQIDFTEPDRKLYRDFDTVVQNAMVWETQRYLEHLLETNAGAEKLIRSDFTFLNSRLARYYDIEGVDGDELRKVKLPSDSPRGGLLSQGSILKVTANGTNTSPVLRGVWVSERILGTPIPPPPESVPAVEPDIRGAKTIRQQLQKHLSDVSCNGCHQNIDPPGYALENFDAAGRWRDQYLQVNGGKSRRGLPVDASFTMADGRSFQDFDEFRSLICEDIRPVAKNFAAHLLAYGTGAAIQFADRDDLDRIVKDASNDDYGLRSLLYAVVTSPTFLNK